MLRVIREVQPKWIVGENVRGLISWNEGLVFDEVQSDLELEGYEVQPYVLPAAGINAPHIRQRVWFIARRRAGRGEYDIPNSDNTGCKDRTEQHRGEPTSEGKGIAVVIGCDTISNAHERIGSQHGLRTGGEMPKDRIEGIGDVAHTKGSVSEGELREGSQQEESGASPEGIEQFFIGSLRPDWENFPTQPPICSGDDELSNRLAGITFSKWRNESIKAYGNAVVPGLVFQIFQTIQDYENLYADNL